jgi:hypothetical protein
MCIDFNSKLVYFMHRASATRNYPRTTKWPTASATPRGGKGSGLFSSRPWPPGRYAFKARQRMAKGEPFFIEFVLYILTLVLILKGNFGMLWTCGRGEWDGWEKWSCIFGLSAGDKSDGLRISSNHIPLIQSYPIAAGCGDVQSGAHERDCPPRAQRYEPYACTYTYLYISSDTQPRLSCLVSTIMFFLLCSDLV